MLYLRMDIESPSQTYYHAKIIYCEHCGKRTPSASKYADFITSLPSWYPNILF